MALADLALPDAAGCEPGSDAPPPPRGPSGLLLIKNGKNDSCLRAPELEET